MLTHRGFSAWIMSDNKPLPEYLVAVDDKAHRVQCWIPSDPGSHFSVHWKDHTGEVVSCAFIVLDGLVVPGRFLHGGTEASRRGVRTSPTTERPFVFTQVTDTVTPTDGPSSKETGLIAIKIKRVQLIGGRWADQLEEPPSMSYGKRIPGDMRIGFGEDVTVSQRLPTTWQAQPLDGGHSYVTFVFRYRSKEFLISQGIMPEASPKPELIELPIIVEAPPPEPQAGSSSKPSTARRITSAPTTVTISTQMLPITPSPTPSPTATRSGSSMAINSQDSRYHPYNIQSKKVSFSRTISLPEGKQDTALFPSLHGQSTLEATSPFSIDNIPAIFSFNMNLSEGSSNHSSPQYIT